MSNVYGFTILKNGIKYDYSFIESLKSLEGLSKKVFLALGDSEDNTECLLEQINNLKIVKTVWDKTSRDGAVVLSEQTNIALNFLRENHGKEKSSWGFYLQCDEVLHENDFALIHEDLIKAEESGYDAITFRYLHFWMDHHHIAINKKWYPQEIRAIKLSTDIESWGDAQSFRNVKKIYNSNARIYHYGHVREEESYANKKRDILKLYHDDNNIDKYKKREKKFDDQTECLNYYGSHPRFMLDRIKRFGEDFDSGFLEELYIVADKEVLQDSFIKEIKVKKLNWVNSIFDVPKNERRRAIIYNKNIFSKMFYPSSVPKKMKSKLSIDWPLEFYILLMFSEKGIRVNY